MSKKPVDRTVAEAKDRPAAYRKSSKRKNDGNRRKKIYGEESAARAEPSHEEVAARAYGIWEREGRPEGEEESHWLEAERLLRALN